jgi:hypothetical protein
MLLIYHPWGIARALQRTTSVTPQQHGGLGTARPTPLDPHRSIGFMVDLWLRKYFACQVRGVTNQVYWLCVYSDIICPTIQPL